MKRKSESEVTQSCPNVFDPMDYIAYHASPSMEFSRQEYWSGLPFPSPEDLPDPGIKPGSHIIGRHKLPHYRQTLYCLSHQGKQPTRLPCPWDSPGKNTGVGCHFLLQCKKVKSESEAAQSCPTLSDPMNCSLPGSSIYGIFQARVLEWGAIAFSDNPQYRV